MRNKVITALTTLFAIFYVAFVVILTDELSSARRNLRKSPNIIDVTGLIETKLLITEKSYSIEDSRLQTIASDWKSIEIPTFQIVQEENFREGNFAYYIVRVPKESFKLLAHLENETSLALQYIYFSKFDVAINGKMFRSYRPRNSIEANVVIPLEDNRENIVVIKASIKNGDTGIDHRDKILLGSGVEFNALHSLSYKGQTVFQLVFILTKGSILLLFAIIYLVTKVEKSFEVFFIFGFCAVLEELIAGEYFYGPLTFNQMVYFYNIVNFGGATAVFLFFSELTNLRLKKGLLYFISCSLFVFTTLLAVDALHWNYIVDLNTFMKCWNLVFVAIMIFYMPKASKIDSILFLTLLVASSLYVWGAIFAVNIGLNFKAYGNLLLFIMVSYQTFVLFRKDQEQLQEKKIQLLEQEKDVVIGKTASILAHDVRKPLEQLKLLVEKIMQGEADEEFLKIAKADIEISVSSVNQQINDVMNYSRTSSIELKEISFYTVLSHSIKQVMVTHQEMDIHFEYEFKCTSKIFGDQSRLVGVLVNLIANAVEALRDIGQRYKGKINFYTECTESEFFFRIFNDGPIIPEEQIHQIFKPLVSFGKSNGTGLGLASVAKTILEHQGSISVRNIGKSGVEFCLTLRKSNERDDFTSYSFKSYSKYYSYEKGDSALKSAPSKFHVLCLKSSDVEVEQFKNFVNTLPFEVVFCFVESKEDAFKLINKRRFDFYLFQKNLGGENVKEALPYLNKEIFIFADTLPDSLIIIMQEAFVERKRILFIDDTRIFRVAWEMYHGSHNITCVASPEEALNLLSTSKASFDFIITDFHFSNSSLDGELLGRKILELIPSARILVASSIAIDPISFRTIRKDDYDVRKIK